MQHRSPTIWFFCALIVVVTGSAQAAMYEGSLSYGSGLYATENWANSNTKLSWTVTDEDPDAPAGYQWKYTYILSVPGKDISHFIVEASDGENPFTEANLTDVTGTKKYEVDLFTPDNSNPDMPGDLYGVKFDNLKDTDVTITFYSDRDPVWGDMYAKDGKNKKKDVLMYNTGFSAADPVAPAASGSRDGHLLRPDSIPEPGLMTLLAVGGFGLLMRRRRITAE